MKAIRIHSAGDLRMYDEPEPVPGEDEVLLEVTAVGICGSDLHWFGEGGIGDAVLKEPLVLGHEFAGIVQSGEMKGQRVAVEPAISCGHCYFCEQGHPNLCENIIFAGHGKEDGALRQYMAWPKRFVIPIPDSIDDVAGAMLEPLGVAIFATDLAKIRLGARVGVYGCGPIGLMIVQLARLLGATQVIATDVLPHRVEAAKANGATDVFQAHKAEEVEAIMVATNQNGVDIAIEVAGDNDAVTTAVETSRPGATVVLVGIPDNDSITFSAGSARRRGLTIKLCRRMKHTYPRAVELVDKGLIDVSSLVSDCYPLAGYQQAFESAARREGFKVVIEPNK